MSVLATVFATSMRPRLLCQEGFAWFGPRGERGAPERTTAAHRGGRVVEFSDRFRWVKEGLSIFVAEGAFRSNRTW